MILSNVTVPLLGMVDTFVMGHLDGPRYLGAVAVGSIVFSFQCCLQAVAYGIRATGYINAELRRSQGCTYFAVKGEQVHGCDAQPHLSDTDCMD